MKESSWGMQKPPWRGGRRNSTTGQTHWNAESGRLALDVGPLDWRRFRTLSIQVVSPERTEGCVRLDILGCEEEPIAHVVFAVDWIGEKVFRFRLDELGRPLEDECWHLVHALELSCEPPGPCPTDLIVGAMEVTTETLT